MRLPEVQQALNVLANKRETPSWIAGELLTLSKQISRRKVIRKAKPVSKPMTKKLAEDIRKLAWNCPDMTQFAIAEHIGVNQARVSEVLRGKRK